MTRRRRRERSIDPLANPDAVRGLLRQLSARLPVEVPDNEREIVRMLRAASHCERRGWARSLRGRPSRYDRNRLLTATTSGVTADYNYDPFGRQESVTAQGKVISRSVYDGFDHVVESQKMDDTGAMKSTTYTFDPLDRTTSKTADGKTTDFTYLGLSGEVLNEEVAGELTKSYQYSPWGERLSQVKHNTDGTTEDGYYGYNSHTDVETLTDDNGDTKATYGYTAYGNDDKDQFTGIDKPDAISRWVWLSMVRAPIAAQLIASPMYCGTMGSSTSDAAGTPSAARSSSSLRPMRMPVSTSYDPSRCGSLMSPFHPTVVRGFSK